MWLTILLIFVIITLMVIIGVLVKALLIQIKKNGVYEGWIVSLQNNVETVYRTMKLLDDKQMFSKDDEVGLVFQQIVELISLLNEMVSKE